MHKDRKVKLDHKAQTAHQVLEANLALPGHLEKSANQATKDCKVQLVLLALVVTSAQMAQKVLEVFKEKSATQAQQAQKVQLGHVENKVSKVILV